MPRIPGPTEPRGAPAVISLPRPRNVQPVATMPALKSPLIEFGGSLSGAGLAVTEHLVRQERSALATRLHNQAIVQYGELESAVDQAGTATEARAIWDKQFPTIVSGIEKAAADAGMPELSGELEGIGLRANISTLTAISRRSASEGVDSVKVLAAAYEERLAGARTTADYMGMRSELHGRLQQVAATNPLLSPGDADGLLLATVTGGAKRRATAMVEGAVNSPSALAAARASILDQNQHPDLPLDARADLVGLTTQMEEALADKAWQQSRRQEMLYNEAREKHQLSTMQSFVGRMAADENVTDQELQLAVAQGHLEPSAFNFLQSMRDDGIQNNPNIFVYDDHRSQAEYGMLSSEEVTSAVTLGAYSWEQGKSLIDSNVSSRRMGGFMRDAEVEAGRDVIVNLVLGSVGNDPSQQVLAFYNASDTEKRIVTNLTTRYDEAIRGAIADGAPPNAINPRRLAGQLLRDAGFAPTRPSPPVASGPFPLHTFKAMTVKEIETDEVRGIPRMVDTLAAGGLSRTQEDELNQQLQAARSYVDQLNQWEMGKETIGSLLDAVPKATGERPISGGIR